MLSPFEMRFNIFNTAKDILETQYKAHLDAWKLMDKTSKEFADLAPKYPTIHEILDKATEINKFVSESTQNEIVKIAKRATGVGVIF
jgi:PII-like signaling protein